jgi:hypothetical protein
MKREWTDLEFADGTLLPSEPTLLANKTGPTRLDFAVLLKFFQYATRFPLSMQEEVPAAAVAQKKLSLMFSVRGTYLVTAITDRARIWDRDDGWKNYSVRRQKVAKQRSRSTNLARGRNTSC